MPVRITPNKNKNDEVLEAIRTASHSALTWYYMAGYAAFIMGRPFVTKSVLGRLKAAVLSDWHKSSHPWKTDENRALIHKKGHQFNFEDIPETLKQTAMIHIESVYGKEKGTSVITTDKVKAYVVGGCRATTKFLDSLDGVSATDGLMTPFNKDLYNMVVFTGGVDVHPSLFGRDPKHNPQQGYSLRRDNAELSIYWATRDTHYHFGICRGLQLLGVAEGMELLAHIPSHQITSGHEITIAKGYNSPYKVVKGVTSSHHQGLLATPETVHRVLAFEEHKPKLKCKRYSGNETLFQQVVEAAWIKESMSFGVQGHPEYASASLQYREFVAHYLLHNEKTGFHHVHPQGEKYVRS